MLIKIFKKTYSLNAFSVVILLMIIAIFSQSVLAWNPPSKDDLKIKMRRDRDGYPIAAHAFIIKRAIELIESDVVDNDKESNFRKAVAAKMREHLLDLYEGVRYADSSGERLRLVYKICVLPTYSNMECILAAGGCGSPFYFPGKDVLCNIARICAIERIAGGGPCFSFDIPWLSEKANFTNYASFEHYYPGLKLPLESMVGDQLIAILGSLIDRSFLENLCSATRIASCELSFSGDIKENYRGADQVATEHFNNAISAFRRWASTGYCDHSLEEKVFFELGWAFHLVTDMAVPHHVNNKWTPHYPWRHEEYEDRAEGMGWRKGFHAVHMMNVEVKYVKNWRASDYVINLAKLTKSRSYIETSPCFGQHSGIDVVRKCPKSRWDRLLKDGFIDAERYTAGLMLKFAREIEFYWTAPLHGIIRQFPEGKPIPNAYVFYRIENKQKTGMWSFVRSEKNGTFTLPLQKGKTYIIRPAFPGWAWVRSDGSLLPGPQRHTHNLDLFSFPKEVNFFLKTITGYNRKPAEPWKKRPDQIGAPGWDGEINLSFPYKILAPLIDYSSLGLPNEMEVEIEVKIFPPADKFIENLKKIQRAIVEAPRPQIKTWQEFSKSKSALDRLDAYKLREKILNEGWLNIKHNKKSINEISRFMHEMDIKIANFQHVDLKRIDRKQKYTIKEQKSQKTEVLHRSLPILNKKEDTTLVDITKQLGNIVRIEIVPKNGYKGRNPESNPLLVKLNDGKGKFILYPGAEAGDILFKVTLIEQTSPGGAFMVGGETFGTVMVQPYLSGSDRVKAHSLLYPILRSIKE